jgi:hypothetical protein
VDQSRIYLEEGLLLIHGLTLSLIVAKEEETDMDEIWHGLMMEREWDP